jgi:hypothetical protein
VIQGYLSLIENWTRANSNSVTTAIIGVLITPVLLAYILSWSGLSDTAPTLQIVHVSNYTPAYEDGTYSDVTAAVQNAGNGIAQGCFVRAYNHLLFSQDIDESSILGSTEQFDLPPQEGLVETVSVYLPSMSGEALLGGGIRAFVAYRFECENADSYDYGGKVVVFPQPFGN